VGAGKKTKSAPDALILPQRDLARTHVYFMQAGEGAIKIGVSDDVWARMASLQTAQPEELKLIACLYCAPHVERTLHRAFEAYSLRGEWFRPSDEIMHLVSLITAKDAAGALQFIDDRDPLLKRH
ncbi:MAG: GIY-YIG nuclease family protein, partial [Boseongicola sp.]|nr:GIY-YIG nuclease family protein [Boseongicola sp.]